MSKKTRWIKWGSNTEDMRSREEKERDRRKTFKNTMFINAMEPMKPKFKRVKKEEEDSSSEE